MPRWVSSEKNQNVNWELRILLQMHRWVSSDRNPNVNSELRILGAPSEKTPHVNSDLRILILKCPTEYRLGKESWVAIIGIGGTDTSSVQTRACCLPAATPLVFVLQRSEQASSMTGHWVHREKLSFSNSDGNQLPVAKQFS